MYAAAWQVTHEMSLPSVLPGLSIVVAPPLAGSDIWSIRPVMFSWKFNLVSRRNRPGRPFCRRSACVRRPSAAACQAEPTPLHARPYRNTFSAARKLLRRLRPPSWGQRRPRSSSAAVGGPRVRYRAIGQPHGPAPAWPSRPMSARGGNSGAGMLGRLQGGGSYWIPALGREVAAWWMVETVADVICGGAAVRRAARRRQDGWKPRARSGACRSTVDPDPPEPPQPPPPPPAKWIVSANRRRRHGGNRGKSQMTSPCMHGCDSVATHTSITGCVSLSETCYRDAVDHGLDILTNLKQSRILKEIGEGSMNRVYIESKSKALV